MEYEIECAGARGIVRFALFVAALHLIAFPLAAQRPLTGVWASDGYGLIFEFAADSFTVDQVTRTSCVRSYGGVRVMTPVSALGAYAVTGERITLLVLPEPGGRARLHSEFTASDMILDRLTRKPAVCDAPTPNTPRSNFDVFTDTWSEHYPFFAEHQVDWPAVVAANRLRVTDATTPSQLFAVLSSMILPLSDAHSGITATSIGRSARPVRMTPSVVPASERDTAYALANAYVGGSLRPFCSRQLEYGMLAPDIAYLRIRSFARYSTTGTFDADTAALGAALDTVFAGARTWKGLVIDVRLNTGGADPYGLLVASRLTAMRYAAYAKQARNDPADASKWTAAQVSTVTPSRRPGFVGPVVELIGVQSVSAAETFTQALLGRQPAVIRLGENTQGVFSDVMVRTLPNGWSFGIPNERFVTNGKSYDVVGIAPDIAVTSLTPSARSTGRDAAIEKAIEIVSR